MEEVILLSQQVIKITQFYNFLFALLFLFLFILKESGYLYGFGSNSESQLGLGDLTNQILNLPQKLPIESKKWKMLVTGATHSCALTGIHFKLKFLMMSNIYFIETGELYVWGMNDTGQSCIKKLEEVKKPTLVTDFNHKISLIACGYYHTAVITGQFFCYRTFKLKQFKRQR